MGQIIRFSLLTLSLIVALGACAAGTTAPTPPTAAPAPPTATSARAAAQLSGGIYADIPQGITPEGYQYLGDPNARLTLVMYSDFL